MWESEASVAREREAVGEGGGEEQKRHRMILQNGKLVALQESRKGNLSQKGHQ